MAWKHNRTGRSLPVTVGLSGVTALAACSTFTAPKQPQTHCGAGQHGSEYQWRSGLGVTADGALVYVVGPVLSPLMLADLLVRAGAVRGMQLDINPTWPVFASFPLGGVATSGGS